MNVFKEACCSVLGVLLALFLQGSCVDPETEVVHKAVGDSLELIAEYPKKDLEAQWKYHESDFAVYQNNDFRIAKPELFSGRLKLYKDNISVTVTNLKLQDSGSFSIVALAVNNTHITQYTTKRIELHVHDLIREVNIQYDYSWLQSQNICLFHLRCAASDDPGTFYSWSGHQIGTQGSDLNITLGPEEKNTVTCTARNNVSIKSTTEDVVCTRKSDGSSFPQKYVLMAVGAGVVAVVVLCGALAACCRWRNKRGPSESEAGITVYEDVNVSPAKKRSESVINGMSIYETVDDTKLSQNLPQTLYDKINYQRHPAVSTSTSSPYQEVL
ncbi:SLAM family member 6 isoform X2 [Puntigrus tetrazona]|nr:SLAM family member 6 isoform X2 [Puntigrus tetrazona]